MRVYLYAVSCAALTWTVWAVLLVSWEETEIQRKGRGLLSADVECIPSGLEAFPGDFFNQEQRQRGGVVVHFIILSYVCAMTAVVCDGYFVPALETIAAKLKLSPDVAGATFMAMGASAPELFSSVAGSFLTENDIGLGTILGSAVFNILGISGIVGLVLWKRSLSIQWYPVVRDCIVYGLTVIVLSFIINDNIILWWEAFILVMIFCSYIILMHFNTKLEEAVSRLVRLKKNEKDPETGPLLPDPPPKDLQEPTEDETPPGGCSFVCRRCLDVLMFVPSLLFRITIPPVRFYPATFAASIVWMGALSYVAVWMVTIIGATFSVPDSVSGLTLLAAGSSVPDLIATVVIAKSGKGNMAISNLLGSNTFDVAFCLGAPWLLKTLLSRSGRILVYSSAMIYTVSTLLVSLLALLLTFLLNGWQLNRCSGGVCLALYAACITLACLYELNVFGEINKPTCG